MSRVSMFYIGNSVITYDRKCHLNRDMNVLPKEWLVPKGYWAQWTLIAKDLKCLKKKKKKRQYKTTEMFRWKGRGDDSVEKLFCHTGIRTWMASPCHPSPKEVETGSFLRFTGQPILASVQSQGPIGISDNIVWWDHKYIGPHWL